MKSIGLLSVCYHESRIGAGTVTLPAEGNISIAREKAKPSEEKA